LFPNPAPAASRPNRGPAAKFPDLWKMSEIFYIVYKKKN